MKKFLLIGLIILLLLTIIVLAETPPIGTSYHPITYTNNIFSIVQDSSIWIQFLELTSGNYFINFRGSALDASEDGFSLASCPDTVDFPCPTASTAEIGQIWLYYDPNSMAT